MINKRFIMVLALLCSILNVFGQSESLISINDSTIARYRYDSEQFYKAEIPTGATIGDIDLLERDELLPRHHINQICIGVNSSDEPFSQVTNIQFTEIEDWMKAPYLHLHTPTNSFGYDSLGTLMYSFPNTPGEILALQSDANFYATEGFQPIMMFFPSKHDDFVQDAINGGAVLTLNGDNSFKLAMNNDEMIINPNDKSIETDYYRDNKHYSSRIEYELFAPFGYVPKYEISKSERTDLPFPIVRTETLLFRNHVIEDQGGVIEKYTDMAHIEVFPNPISSQYEVLLQGIPDAAISQIQIRDHMGNIIHTHIDPSVSGNLIELDGSSYTSGPLIIIVYTQHGIYTETLTKL